MLQHLKHSVSVRVRVRVSGAVQVMLSHHGFRGRGQAQRDLAGVGDCSPGIEVHSAEQEGWLSGEFHERVGVPGRCGGC